MQQADKKEPPSHYPGTVDSLTKNTVYGTLELRARIMEKKEVIVGTQNMSSVYFSSSAAKLI
jgi:hypothetical protein